MKLNVKLFLGFLFGSLVLVYILSMVSYKDFSNILKKQLLTEKKQEALVQKDTTEQFLKNLESEVVNLSNIDKKRDYLGVADPTAKENEREEMTTLITTYLKERGIYKSVAIMDNYGQEFVNINWDENDLPIDTPVSRLKSKQNTYIFQNTKDLNEGEIFVALTIDKPEEGASGQRAILTNSTPIFNVNGERKGVLILSVFADSMLKGTSYNQAQQTDETENNEEETDNIMLANKDGYYLHNPDQNKEWNLFSKDSRTLYDDYPEVKPFVGESASGEIYNKNTESYLIFYPIKPYSERVKKIYNGPSEQTADEAYPFIFNNGEDVFWIQASLIEGSEISNKVNILFFKTLTLILLTLMFFIIGMMMFLQRAVIEPIGKIINGADRIKKGNLDYRLSLGNRKDEFGDLANEFNSMSAVLKRYKETMEQKIEERTSDLDKFRKSVEKNRECMIISDVKGVVLYTNEALERVTGYGRSEVINREASIKELWGGTIEPGKYDNIWKTVRDGKQPFLGKIKNKNSNGEQYTALLSITPMVDKEGNILYFFSILSDLKGIEG
ncbi:MAG: hypothetical protein A2206_01070 [Candidatus Magasanikbacteria bacterium RIFOXYA1_FULL_40_8]|nr:MAG: hypothetical protein A2206_01070 [Candidatus Magasanikbacteria bacterium RIFOXYA1_FULL_40_8]